MRRKNDRRLLYLMAVNVLALAAVSWAIYELRKLTNAILEAAAQKYELRSY